VTPFAHISDLHLGHSEGVTAAAERLCRKLVREGPELVLLTGDVTHRGLRRELELFRDIFAPLLRAGRILSVPGNHDRLGDDVGSALMDGRVRGERRGGLYVVRADSTGPQNRRRLDGYGSLSDSDLHAIEAALLDAPAGLQTVLMLHHHPLPLPDEHPVEWLLTQIGSRCSRELRKGATLLSRGRGLCDVVLHGHRHRAAEHSPFPRDPRPLRVVNAGSSTLLGRFRAFASAREPGRWLGLAQS
jgi:3',5'-cyclic AMP phosphodiesterase CpdA